MPSASAARRNTQCIGHDMCRRGSAWITTRATRPGIMSVLPAGFGNPKGVDHVVAPSLIAPHKQLPLEVLTPQKNLHNLSQVSRVKTVGAA
jgi:hypothetical protein